MAGDDAVTNDQTQLLESKEIRFSPEQYKALLALIQQPTDGNSANMSSNLKQIASCSVDTTPAHGKSLSFVNHTHTLNTWILDSGATDHVSASLDLFKSYTQLNPPTVVRLPNGHHVTATHSGDICISDSIILSTVLYVPSFSFNMISISKLVSTNSCKLIFSSNSCLMQDVITQAKIGTVEVRNGLYYLTPNYTAISNIETNIVHPHCTITPIDLWHFRMGHLSFERL